MLPRTATVGRADGLADVAVAGWDAGAGAPHGHGSRFRKRKLDVTPTAHVPARAPLMGPC